MEESNADERFKDLKEYVMELKDNVNELDQIATEKVLKNRTIKIVSLDSSMKESSISREGSSDFKNTSNSIMRGVKDRNKTLDSGPSLKTGGRELKRR